jgi:predicted PurR-regulated permease PerM
LSTTLWRMLVLLLAIIALWTLRAPLMIGFGAVLFAATLHALSAPLRKHTRWAASTAAVVTLLVLVVVLAVALFLLGGPLAEQLQGLRDELPKAWQAAQGWLAKKPWGHRVLALAAHWNEAPLPWANIAGFAGGALRAVSDIVLIVLLGTYLALDVALYRDGLVRLFPVTQRDAVKNALDAAGDALSRWLLGQAVLMLMIGVAVAIGLALLGMPLAMALGAIAAVLEFVPFFGPIASGLLAVLVAFVQGPAEALWVVGLFVAVQQVEGNLLVPLVQRWAVELPPAIGVGAVVVFGSLFGLWGVVFGTPLAVVTMVLVRKLYVEDHLEAGGRLSRRAARARDRRATG